MPNLNQEFLSTVDAKTKEMILQSIAKHYEVTVEQAYAEVSDAEAEHLLEYLVEPQRTATLALMRRHGYRRTASA
ncbi:hypothetical protein DU506_00615 [Vreelandella rituensis]|uniref:Uncharacterized protein n=1 Tax=Vreelandella rituensis TaxID=2282306 RepID=A0A368UDM7_9GAMM|nr:hypothetical protein DU506_00615 [Halomonas rituensis]